MNKLIKWIMVIFLLLSGCAVQKEEIKENTIDSWDDVETSRYRKEEKKVFIDGQMIWGEAWIPETGKDKYPLVICSHGLGANYSTCFKFAELLATHGIATYCFDFRGGGGNRSDGSRFEMSLLTEADDLDAVIDSCITWDFVDKDKIILLGESQGGAVSAISAGRKKDVVNGLIMYYPAFVVPDWVHEMFKTKEDITVRFNFMWLPLGRKYAEDVWEYDPYSEIGSYDKPVLLMHGDKDELVPLSYSDEAAKCYKDVDYYVIKDGQHGFTGDKEEQANKYLLDYLLKIKVIQ